MKNKMTKKSSGTFLSFCFVLVFLQMVLHGMTFFCLRHKKQGGCGLIQKMVPYQLLVFVILDVLLLMALLLSWDQETIHSPPQEEKKK